ncbi:ketosteroid isomerase [Acuticoccus sediminis]|uniref:Ketosteroid isomerase n=1 Tax=Acuticoccus sediminis TaxID=2184697 RepID=A0A8B2NF20_9HYPH|nr:nuclear transport factor 2 family protein [Acuticoccus sediminis]RAH96105.1 ketosteroid isomerase [Acuticoccus sediminis]
MTLARSLIRRRRAPLVAVAALLASLLTAPLSAQAQTAEDNRRIVREAYEAWARGENVFARVLSEDVVWTIHGSDPVAGTYVGREDFVERASVPLVSRLVAPIRPEVHRIWAEDDTVVVRFSGSTTTTSGAPYHNEFVWIFTLEDGKVTRAEAFLDLAAYRTVVENNEPLD